MVSPFDFVNTRSSSSAATSAALSSPKHALSMLWWCLCCSNLTAVAVLAGAHLLLLTLLALFMLIADKPPIDVDITETSASIQIPAKFITNDHGKPAFAAGEKSWRHELIPVQWLYLLVAIACTLLVLIGVSRRKPALMIPYLTLHIVHLIILTLCVGTAIISAWARASQLSTPPAESKTEFAGYQPVPSGGVDRYQHQANQHNSSNSSYYQHYAKAIPKQTAKRSFAPAFTFAHSASPVGSVSHPPTTTHASSVHFLVPVLMMLCTELWIVAIVAGARQEVKRQRHQQREFEYHEMEEHI